MNPHNAPPVIYPLGRSRFQGGLLLAGWLIAGVVMGAWWRVAEPGDRGPLLGGLVWLAVAWAMLTGWRRAPLGQLQWDGQRWRWESPVYQEGSALSPPEVVLDLQRALLLRLENQAGATWWLWADRFAAPGRWLDLRRAVYARHRPETLSGTHGSWPGPDPGATTVEQGRPEPAPPAPRRPPSSTSQ